VRVYADTSGEENDENDENDENRKSEGDDAQAFIG
jgi:hypothetical protein